MLTSSRSGSRPTGVKVPLGLWEGSTENATVATRAALRPRRPRPRSRAGGAVRGRRLQGAPQGGPQRVRRRRRCSAASATRSATCSTTCPSATGRPSSCGCAARGRSDDHARALDGLCSSPTSSTAPIPAPPARSARACDETLTAHPPRDPRAAQAHAREHQPDRVDDRDRPPHPRNVKRWHSGDMACAGPPPACSKPSSSSAGSSATATSPSSPSRSSATSTVAAPRYRSHPRGGRYAPHRLTITPGPPSRSSTTNGTTSRTAL